MNGQSVSSHILELRIKCPRCAIEMVTKTDRMTGRGSAARYAAVSVHCDCCESLFIVDSERITMIGSHVWAETNALQRDDVFCVAADPSVAH